MSDEKIGYAAISDTGDTLELIPAPGIGMFMVRARRGEHEVTHLLPRGFETWDRDMIEAHMKREVAPRLKTKLERLAAGIDKPDPVTEADVLRIEAAREKREMRAAKRAEVLRADLPSNGGDDEPA